ncbi:MAG: hypothetical protein A2Z09_03415 [Nitrospirae bacterium RBG_16_43_8]|nr:MAG: hypothetical protein A2Z09_03415 [Nitrospirae bacterium RBG_16_43_8]
MGEQQIFQPLTKEDKVTVVLYRIGIVFSALIISLASYMLFSSMENQDNRALITVFNILLILLYISVSLSVFFIHLYISKFKRTLKKLYYMSVAALVILLIVGKGNMLGVVANKPYGPLLLIPLSLCLGFIAAKEAFCFKLTEGYLLAFIMPLYLFLFSARMISFEGAAYGLLLIAFMLLFFTLRKVFMPIHYDIGNKSAYT